MKMIVYVFNFRCNFRRLIAMEKLLKALRNLRNKSFNSPLVHVVESVYLLRDKYNSNEFYLLLTVYIIIYYTGCPITVVFVKTISSTEHFQNLIFESYYSIENPNK